MVTFSFYPSAGSVSSNTESILHNSCSSEDTTKKLQKTDIEGLLPALCVNNISQN